MNEDEALRRAVRSVGPGKVAARAKIPFSTLSMWLNDETRDMRGNTKTKVAAAVRALSTDAPEPVKHLGETFYPVPFYDIRASAGRGALVEEGEPNGHMLYQQTWLNTVTKAPLAALSIIQVSGDSMEETLRSGDQILVDRSVKRIVRDGIYILLYEDELLVKRCQRDLKTGEIIVKSDNKKYDPMRLGKNDRLEVIGIVIWVGRQIG